MKAVVYRQNGPASVMEVVERPRPVPQEGEVLVRLARAGVNPTDWKARERAELGFPEVTPGEDGAGVVVDVGPGVRSLSTGQEVWVMLAQHERPYGTAAEYVAVPEDRAVALPPGASFDLGAALGIPAVTAHGALTSGRDTRLGPGTMAGRHVLVAGGAGAVGNAAIQLARWSDAVVIATVSSAEKARLAAAAGAHHVLNYREDPVADAVRDLTPDGVDLVVEVAPAANRDLDLEVIAEGGTVAVYGTDGGDSVTLPVRRAWARNTTYRFVMVYGFDRASLAAAAADLNAAITEDRFGVGAERGLPLHTYPLGATDRAHDAVQSGAVGKVLIDTE